MFVLSIFVLVHMVNDGQLLKDMEGQKPDDKGNHRSNRRNVVCMDQMENCWKHIKGHHAEQHPRSKTENFIDLLGTFQIPVDSFQETSGKTRAVATKTVNYFCP